MSSSKGLKMSTKESGGLYQVVTTKGLDLGFLISIDKLSNEWSFRSVRTE